MDRLLPKLRWILFPALSMLIACGGGGSASDAEPSKEAVVGLMSDLVDALESENYARAAEYLVFPPEQTSNVTRELSRWIERREVSRAGIAVLEANGEYGPLAEIFKDRGAQWAERAGVPLDQAWGLKYENAEVAVARADGVLKLIRLDDVGKLSTE